MLDIRRFRCRRGRLWLRRCRRCRRCRRDLPVEELASRGKNEDRAGQGHQREDATTCRTSFSRRVRRRVGGRGDQLVESAQPGEVNIRTASAVRPRVQFPSLVPAVGPGLHGVRRGLFGRERHEGRRRRWRRCGGARRSQPGDRGVPGAAGHVGGAAADRLPRVRAQRAAPPNIVWRDHRAGRARASWWCPRCRSATPAAPAAAICAEAGRCVSQPVARNAGRVRVRGLQTEVRSPGDQHDRDGRADGLPAAHRPAAGLPAVRARRPGGTGRRWRRRGRVLAVDPGHRPAGHSRQRHPDRAARRRASPCAGRRRRRARPRSSRRCSTSACTPAPRGRSSASSRTPAPTTCRRR